MERSSNLREALLADALGDLHELLNRADKLVTEIQEAGKAIDEARNAMVTTTRGMTAEGETLKRQILAAAGANKNAALKYLADNTKQLVAELTIRQTRAMSDTAQSLVETQVGPKLRVLATKLEAQANRANDPWRDAAAHALTGVVAGCMTAAVLALALAAYISDVRRPAQPADEPPPQAVQAPAPEPKSSAAAAPSGRRARASNPGDIPVR